MNKRVWCRLPDELLLERMLPLLPLPSLLRLRGVCKSWNSYILSCKPCCTINRGASSTTDHVLVLSTWSQEWPLLAFDPAHEKWHAPSLPACITNKVGRTGDGREGAAADACSLVAAAGGLLCVSTGPNSLAVCNPVTQADAIGVDCELPLFQVLQAGMRACSRSFQIVLVGNTGEGRQVTCVYDSGKRAWSPGVKQHHETLFFGSGGVFYGESFFATASFPSRLMVLSLETGTWREHEAGIPARARLPCLVRCGERLVLVAAEEGDEELEETDDDEDTEDDGKPLAGVRLWRLDEGAHVWRELAHMPDPIFQQIVVNPGLGSDGMWCAARDDRIYMVTQAAFLVFDACLDTWRFLPHSPILSGLQACMRDIFILRPSLETVASLAHANSLIKK